MIIPFFVQFIYGEENSTFLSSASVTAFIGILLVLTNLEENRKLNANLREVVLYTKETCPYCINFLKLLDDVELCPVSILPHVA